MQADASRIFAGDLSSTQRGAPENGTTLGEGSCAVVCNLSKRRAGAVRNGSVLHTVGAAPKIEAAVFPMIMGQKSLSSSPTGSIGATRTMFEFCARHEIVPEIETFPMSEINQAFERIKQAPALRVVLTR